MLWNDLHHSHATAGHATACRCRVLLRLVCDEALGGDDERGEEQPGKTLANLKTAGMDDLLAQLIASGWKPQA